MPKKLIKEPHDSETMRAGNKGGVAVLCDTDEAIKYANNAGTPEEPHRMYPELTGRESNQTKVIESMKGIGSPTANAHRVGDRRAADAWPNSSTNGALTPSLTNQWETKGTAGYLSGPPRAWNIRQEPVLIPGWGSRTSDSSRA